MRKKIDIAQFASGSRTDHIGDTTLFYSAGYSRHANDVSGLFIDNPPVLSPRYASVAWLYHADVDKYLLLHVQGSHVVSTALGRNYPFRAGYEVSRDDMNQIAYNLRTLFAQMPRIKGMPTGRVDSTHYIDVTAPYASSEAIHLASHIKKAMATGRPLYIALPVAGDTYHCDGVLESAELALLTDAIESLPLPLRRYATFGFAVDEHYERVLAEALIKVYVAGSPLSVPDDALHLKWYEATTTDSRLTQAESHTIESICLPGQDTPLLSYTTFRHALGIYDKRPDQLTADEWPLWLQLGHSLSDLRTESWSQLRHYQSKMDNTTRQRYTALQRAASVQWPIGDLDEATYALMPYSEEERQAIRRKALRPYLESGQYRYLFGEGGIGEELKAELDSNFIRDLQLNSRPSIEQWYHIFKEQGRINDDGVRKAFAKLYETYVTPQLSTMDEILRYMKECPFIAVSAFRKPAHLYKPGKTDDLKDDYRRLIDKWIDEAVGDTRFNSLESVMHILSAEKGKKEDDFSLEAESLRRMSMSDLQALLKGKGSEETVFEHCEQLLRMSKGLPTKWEDFVKGTVIIGVSGLLFGSKPVCGGKSLWHTERIKDIDNWPKLGVLCDKYPHVAVLARSRIAHMGTLESADATARKIISTFSKAGKSTGEGESLVPRKSAENAYPIIKTFLTTYKKQNRKMAKEIETIFKELKRAKSDRQRSRRAWMNLLIGLVAGAVIGAGGLLAYRLNKDSKKGPANEPQIVLSDSQEHLMLQLARLDDWKTLHKLVIDGTTQMEQVNLNDMGTLCEVDKAYYASPTAAVPTQEAKVVVSALPVDDGKSTTKADTLAVNAQQPLLQQVYAAAQPLHIEQVIVNDSVTIAIPTKELFGEESGTLSTRDARYYLGVVKYVGNHLPASIDIAY